MQEHDVNTGSVTYLAHFNLHRSFDIIKDPRHFRFAKMMNNLLEEFETIFEHKFLSYRSSQYYEFKILHNAELT